MSRGLSRVGRALAAALAAVAASAAGHAASPDDIASGKKIAFSRSEGNCIACHSLPGAAMAGNIGPRLGPWIKTVFPTKAALVSYLYDPQAKIPHVVMPEFGKNGVLTEKQLQAVADYLWSLER
jgi:L-cysteine S-thiosulfotransferase